MPRRDGTGPRGLGPMTGWGAGNCMGARAGLGYGIGRGLRCNPYGYAQNAVYSSQTDIDLLMQEQQILKNRLEIISKALDNKPSEPQKEEE